MKFNLSDAPERKVYDSSPIATGDYPAVVMTSEIKRSKSSDGQYISVMVSITDGQYENRRLWDLFMVESTSDKALEIGRSNLRSLASACGLDINSFDETDLIDRTVTVKVGLDKSDSTRNKIIGYAATAKMPRAPAPAPTTQPSVSVEKPW